MKSPSIVGIRAEIWTGNLTNAKQECSRSTVAFGWVRICVSKFVLQNETPSNISGAVTASTHKPYMCRAGYIRKIVYEIKDIRTRPRKVILRILEQAPCHLWCSRMQISTLKIQFMLWGSRILICYRSATKANPPNVTSPPSRCTKPLSVARSNAKLCIVEQ